MALLKHHKAQVHIGKDLTTDQPSAFVQINTSAYIHEDPELPDMVTLVNSGIEPIDIPVAMLLTYTNCMKKEQACSLLELAIASNALQVYVIQCDYWKNASCSSLRGIPIINTELLLQAIEPSKVGEQTCFPTSNTMVVEDVTYNIQIHVAQVSAVLCALEQGCILTPPSCAGAPRRHPRPAAARTGLLAFVVSSQSGARLQDPLRAHRPRRQRDPPLLVGLLRRIASQNRAHGRAQ